MAKFTDFGFEKIPETEKNRRVAQIFHSVANRYDVMNDLMSVGLHRLWKRFTVEQSNVKPGDRVLDIAGGSGDLAIQLKKRVGSEGSVFLTDINSSMLNIGRDRLLDKGQIASVIQCNAENLPFPDNYFDCVVVGFGLRNMTRKDIALKEMHRVVRPGGITLVLEFSTIWEPLQPLYDAYSFKLLPLIGKWVARDEASYRYLAESIRMHPSQEALKQMLLNTGFDRVDYLNLSAGIVALHKAYKF